MRADVSLVAWVRIALTSSKYSVVPKFMLVLNHSHFVLNPHFILVMPTNLFTSFSQLLTCPKFFFYVIVQTVLVEVSLSPEELTSIFCISVLQCIEREVSMSEVLCQWSIGDT